MVDGIGVGWDSEIDNVRKDIENGLIFNVPEIGVDTTYTSGNGYGMSSRIGSQIVVNQYIYSQAKSAAQLMREARWEAERAVMAGV